MSNRTFSQPHFCQTHWNDGKCSYNPSVGVAVCLQPMTFVCECERVCVFVHLDAFICNVKSLLSWPIFFFYAFTFTASNAIFNFNYILHSIHIKTSGFVRNYIETRQLAFYPLNISILYFSCFFANIILLWPLECCKCHIKGTMAVMSWFLTNKLILFQFQILEKLFDNQC